MDAQNYENVSPKNVDLCKILKIHEKILFNPGTFIFVIVLYFKKRRCSQIEPQWKVQIKDGCEAPSLITFLKNHDVVQLLNCKLSFIYLKH